MHTYFSLPVPKSLKVYLNVLSYHKGKDDITRAAQKFCREVKNKETQSKIMNVEHLSHLLEGSGIDLYF